MSFSSALYLLLLVITVSESKPQVGGINAADGAFPYLASIRDAGTGQHFCGGSIISPNWILTAAHCVRKPDLQPSSVKVVVGTISFEGGTTYDVSEIIVHEGFNYDAKVTDIALIRINGAISYNPKVTSIGLSSSDLPAGSSVISSGWGLTDPQDKSSIAKILQYNRVTSISIEKCLAAFQGQAKIDNTQICTFDRVGQGICDGDSGGPLVQGNVQYGIVSWGTEVCGDGLPDVFTNVASHRNWIQQKTGV